MLEGFYFEEKHSLSILGILVNVFGLTFGSVTKTSKNLGKQHMKFSVKKKKFWKQSLCSGKMICSLNTLLFLQVACGLNHTLAVSADGSMVWAFGDGDYGKLGLGNSTAKSSPQVSYCLEPQFEYNSN